MGRIKTVLKNGPYSDKHVYLSSTGSFVFAVRGVIGCYKPTYKGSSTMEWVPHIEG